MIDYIKSYEFMSMLALFTYWIPLTVCLIVYLGRFVKAYKIDMINCQKESYRPQLTIGAVIWGIICAATPAINLFTLVFDCAGSVFKWLGKTFDQPLIRHRPKAQ